MGGCAAAVQRDALDVVPAIAIAVDDDRAGGGQGVNGIAIIVSVIIGYLIWGRHDHFNAFWMSLLAIWIGINIRAFIMGGYRVATKKGSFMFEPADDSPAWGPAGPRSDVDLVIETDPATQPTSGAL